jgi:Flp pilus assembly protein TadD
VQLSAPYDAKIAAEVRRRERAAAAEERAARRRRRRDPGTNRTARHPSEEEKFFNASAAMLGQGQAYLGATLIQKGSYAQAEAALKKATVQNPENPEWWAMLGVAQIEQRKYAAARRSLRSALFLEPYDERYAELLKRAGGRSNR